MAQPKIRVEDIDNLPEVGSSNFWWYLTTGPVFALAILGLFAFGLPQAAYTTGAFAVVAALVWAIVTRVELVDPNDRYLVGQTEKLTRSGWRVLWRWKKPVLIYRAQIERYHPDGYVIEFRIRDYRLLPAKGPACLLSLVRAFVKLTEESYQAGFSNITYAFGHGRLLLDLHEVFLVKAKQAMFESVSQSVNEAHGVHYLHKPKVGPTFDEFEWWLQQVVAGKEIVEVEGYTAEDLNEVFAAMREAELSHIDRFLRKTAAGFGIEITRFQSV